MKVLVTMFLCQLLVSMGVVKSNFQEIKEKDGILLLNKDNFDLAIKNHSHVLVKFYSPYCALSKKLEPEFIAAAKRLLEVNPNSLVKFGEINSQNDPELVKKYKVDGFPTIKLFTLGHETEYSGGRTEKEIVSWLLKNTGSSSLDFFSPLEANNYIQQQDVILVGFSLNRDQLDEFQKVSKDYASVEFAHCDSQECLQFFEAEPGQLVLFKKFDEKKQVYDGVFDAASVKKYLDIYSHELVMQFDKNAARLVFGNDTPGMFFYLRKDSEAENEKLRSIAREVALELRQHKIQVVVTGLVEEIEVKLGKYTDVKEADLPCVRIHDTRDKLVNFVFKGEIATENVVQFYQKWVNGFIKSQIRSQERPEKNDGAITIVVGDTFNELVIKPNKHVFLMIYDKTSLQFSKQAPVWMDLAKKHLNSPEITIAMMDGLHNEIDSEAFEKLPIFKLWVKGQKDKPREFLGDADIDLFQKFLEVNCPELRATKSDL